MDDKDPSEFDVVAAEVDELAAEIKALLPALVKSRRDYMKSRSPADKAENSRLEDLAKKLNDRHSALYEQLQQLSGLPAETLAAIDRPQVPDDGVDRRPRESLVRDKVATTGMVDDHIASALDLLRRIVPKDQLEEQSNVSHRLERLRSGQECLSLVRGLRPESELSDLHRFRQMVRVGADYLDNNPAYDQFAGAMLVPQLAQFGNQYDNLMQVGGAPQNRAKRLWEHESASVDGTLFELLVAAKCVEKGRNVEFIDEGNEKTPDIRCHDPYPLQIECKRKRALSDYEIAEELLMRALFLVLETEAKRKGLTGRFDLVLSVEARQMPAGEVVARLISQRLAAHPDRPTEYSWGSVAFHPLPSRFDVPRTRLYSPHMLMAAFDWNTDLPEWDGLLCRVDGADGFEVDRVKSPIGLVWSNTNRRAVQKRAWSPVDLFGDATKQITPGEFGIIYLAYNEGTRATVADERLQRFFSRILEWEHSGSIRLPISLLVRLYPRPLDHGVPDLIESTVRLYSGTYGDPRLFEDFPQGIFTP